MGSTVLLAPETSLNHQTPHGHPERPERFKVVTQMLQVTGLMEQMDRIKPVEAEFETLNLCHSEDYIALVEKEVAAGNRQLTTGDTHISKCSLTAARFAVGAVCTAIDAILQEPATAKQAFCVLRPPGHHARPSQGMGFCIFNSIAIGARHAVQRKSLERVLIVDWDVHHGNGTQDIFYEDPDVLFFSTHQAPWYPGTGKTWETGDGKGLGSTMNYPFPEGSGRDEILGAFREKLVPAANSYKPDLVMISAGFDSRLGDPLGRFRLTDEDFREMTTLLQEIADKHAQGRLVSVLEGGYSLRGLAAGVQNHVETLLG